MSEKKETHVYQIICDPDWGMRFPRENKFSIYLDYKVTPKRVKGVLESLAAKNEDAKKMLRSYELTAGKSVEIVKVPLITKESDLDPIIRRVAEIYKIKIWYQPYDKMWCAEKNEGFGVRFWWDSKNCSFEDFFQEIANFFGDKNNGNF